MGGIDSRCIKQFGDAGGCWVYLPNEKIVGLEGKELSILLSVFFTCFHEVLVLGLYFFGESRYDNYSFWGGVMLQDDL